MVASGSKAKGRSVGRPKAQVLSRRTVVETALRLVDEHGLSSWSLKQLGKELGVHESSIYHHYRYKDQILTDVARYVLSSFVVDSAHTDWKSYFTDFAPVYYRALAEHPKIIPFMMANVTRKFGFEFENRTAELLLEGGVPQQYVLPIRQQLEALAIGAVQFGTSKLFEDVPDAYPALQTAVERSSDVSSEESFDLALRLFIEGLELQIERWRSASEVPG